MSTKTNRKFVMSKNNSCIENANIYIWRIFQVFTTNYVNEYFQKLVLLIDFCFPLFIYIFIFTYLEKYSEFSILPNVPNIKVFLLL